MTCLDGHSCSTGCEMDEDRTVSCCYTGACDCCIVRGSCYCAADDCHCIHRWAQEMEYSND